MHFFEAYAILNTILVGMVFQVSPGLPLLLKHTVKQEDEVRVFQVEDSWSMENSRISSRPDPMPGPGEVRIQMKASALNYRDLIVPERGYGSRMKTLPLIMLSDGVGVVETLGEGVKHLRVGDRVCPLFFQSWIGGGEPDKEKLSLSLGCEIDGTMAEFMVLPEGGAALAPAHLDDMEAASLPTAAVTAWRTLVTEGGVPYQWSTKNVFFYYFILELA